VHLNIFSEKGSIGFTRLSKGSKTQKRLRTTECRARCMNISTPSRYFGKTYLHDKESETVSWCYVTRTEKYFILKS
jgi:hypothetical protein